MQSRVSIAVQGRWQKILRRNRTDCKPNKIAPPTRTWTPAVGAWRVETLQWPLSAATVRLLQMTHQNYTNTAQEKSTQLHTYQFNGPFSRTTRVSRYQKGKTNLDFTEARDSERLWHQLGHMQVCTSLQTDNHASAPPLSFLQAGCPSCRPTNSIKALHNYNDPNYKSTARMPLPRHESMHRWTENSKTWPTVPCLLWL